MRRKFIDCLNKEPKLFNCNWGALIVGGVLLVVFSFGWGFFYGMGLGIVGFVFGGWLGREWYMGKLQRKLYWNMPYGNIWINKNIPSSSNRREM